MSDDLSALVRAAALEEEAAAGRELPYSAATLGRYVRDIRRRRAVGGAMLGVAGVVVIGGALFGIDHLVQAGPAPVAPIGTSTPSVSPSSALEPTPTSTPTPAPTPDPTLTAIPTPTQTPTSPPPVESAAPPTHEETSAPPVAPLPEPPGAVSIVFSGPGGGSGEVMVTWTPTPGATGYRVYRSDIEIGPFALSASFDVATGRTTVAFGGAHEYIQIWQPQSGDYRDFQYIEAIHGDRGYFRVTAVNAGGEGPMSGVVCGEPQTGQPPTQC